MKNCTMLAAALGTSPACPVTLPVNAEDAPLSTLDTVTVAAGAAAAASVADDELIDEVFVVGQRRAYQGNFDELENPAAQQTIDVELLRDVGALNLNDALDLSASVARQNNFGGLWNSFSVRGFSGDINLPSGFLVNGFNAGRGFGGPRDIVGIRRSLNRQAVAAGAPTVLLETGENGRRDEADVQRIVTGLKDALAVLGMLPKQPARQRVAPRYFDGTQSVKVEHSGLWTPKKRVGRFVEKGEVIGSIRDYSGQVVETVVAPVSGYAIYGLAGPPIRAGDSVMSIALPVESLD